MALPLGLGKANHVANALVELALDYKDIDLRIITALTLGKPRPTSELKRRFLNPAMDRLFGRYPELLYEKLLRENSLPSNIQVNEFFFLAGQWLNNGKAQQNYIPANYTHALPYLLESGVNVLAQLVSRKEASLSLSSNTDISADLLKLRRESNVRFVFVAQVNGELPFMTGEAQISEDDVDLILESPETDFELYRAPKRPISLADQAIGLHVARLVPDGGTLQIGIGSIGDGIAQGLILRHKKNSEFRVLVDQFGLKPSRLYHYDTFETGIYGLSEMFVDGFMHLAEHGILKRQVEGAILHGAFFVDCADFYERLRSMSDLRRAQFQMKPVSFTNELYGNEKSKRKARVGARFVNNAMMATLDGAVVSDALDDGRVVSGVGGQYNFVAQAFALQGARSIITVNSTRESQGETRSNIVWSYGHETIPWHLRDIVVSEYGIADLRGKTEQEVVKAMLFITDARFQPELLAKAKQAKKIEQSWNLPSHYRKNTPAHLRDLLREPRLRGTLPKFPFGTSFTETEQRLLPALKLLDDNSHSLLRLSGLIASLLLPNGHDSKDQDCLERMGLSEPTGMKEFVYTKLLQAALAQTRNAV